MTKASGVYAITAPSGKQYVGSAKCIRKRLYMHRYLLARGLHHNKPMQAAFIKYGGKEMQFGILLICRPNDLLLYEQRAIDILRPAYNILKVAGSTAGSILSEEHRKKISASNKGRHGLPHSEESRARISAAMRGKKHSPETISRMALAKTGVIATPEARLKMSNSAKLRRHSPETLAKMRAAWLIRKQKVTE